MTSLTVDQIKLNIKYFGGVPKGKKDELNIQLSTILDSLTFTQIKGMVPEVSKKSKVDYISYIKNNLVVKNIQSVQIDDLSQSSSSALSSSLEPVSKPFKRSQIPKHVRVLVWNRWIGADIGKIKCPCCNTIEIQQGACNGWHASHVLSDANGGESIVENLRAICNGCNSAMSKKHMKEYCLQYHGEDSLSRLFLNDVTDRSPIENEDVDIKMNNLSLDDKMPDIPEEIKTESISDFVIIEPVIPSISDQPSISSITPVVDDRDDRSLIMESLKKSIDDNYKIFKTQIQNTIRCNNTKLYENVFSSFINIADIDITKFDIKGMWKLFIKYIKTPTSTYLNNVGSQEFNIIFNLKQMINLSSQFEAYNKGKKIYKWKIDDVVEISESSYSRCEKFGFGQYNHNLSNYGQKHWTILGKLSCQELYQLHNIIQNIPYGTQFDINEPPVKLLSKMKLPK